MGRMPPQISFRMRSVMTGLLQLSNYCSIKKIEWARRECATGPDRQSITVMLGFRFSSASPNSFPRYLCSRSINSGVRQSLPFCWPIAQDAVAAWDSCGAPIGRISPCVPRRRRCGRCSRGCSRSRQPSHCWRGRGCCPGSCRRWRGVVRGHSRRSASPAGGRAGACRGTSSFLLVGEDF